MAEQVAAGPDGNVKLAACNSCGHEALRSEMTAELKFNWEPTGNVVCADPDACYARWVILP